jgi:hypothetical protein
VEELGGLPPFPWRRTNITAPLQDEGRLRPGGFERPSEEGSKLLIGLDAPIPQQPIFASSWPKGGYRIQLLTINNNYDRSVIEYRATGRKSDE